MDAAVHIKSDHVTLPFDCKLRPAGIRLISAVKSVGYNTNLVQLNREWELRHFFFAIRFDLGHESTASGRRPTLSSEIAPDDYAPKTATAVIIELPYSGANCLCVTKDLPGYRTNDCLSRHVTLWIIWRRFLRAIWRNLSLWTNLQR